MRQRFGFWLALATIAIPLLFVSPAQGTTPDPSPIESPPPDPTETPTPGQTETPTPEITPDPTPTPCMPGEMVVVSSGGMIIGSEMVKENGCTREYWEFVDLCPATILNPDYTPPEQVGFESEPDPSPQPEFLRPYCEVLAAFRLQRTEELAP